MGIKTQEAFNFYSHFAGALLSIAGMIFLFRVAGTSVSATITALIYGLSVTFLFFASSLYHAFKKEENEVSFWRRMDRLAIFFMIAGTYTPISYFCLEGKLAVDYDRFAMGAGRFRRVFPDFFPESAPHLLCGHLFYHGVAGCFSHGTDSVQHDGRSEASDGCRRHCVYAGRADLRIQTAQNGSGGFQLS
jgi:hemolysin III